MLKLGRKIKKIVKNNNELHYLALCIYKFKDYEYRNKIIGLEKDYSMVKVNKNKGTNDTYSPIYRIELGSDTIGFFALLRLTINAFAYADYYGFKPVVIYRECISYFETDGFNGTFNPFEYYFEQPSGIIDDTLMSCSKSYLECIPAHITQIFRMYGLSEVQDYLIQKEHYLLFADIMKKYLRYNQQITDQLEKDTRSFLLHSQIIGIHYRGTDFKNNYGSHPVSIDIQDYINEINKLNDEYQKLPIFIATDDINALQMFIDNFKDRILFFNDVERSDGNLSVICSVSHRKNHHFLLGYEVIRDMYMLSKCNVLIAGLSQVSIFARIQKLSRDESFEKEIVINKGININTRSHIQHIRRAKKS